MPAVPRALQLSHESGQLELPGNAQLGEYPFDLLPPGSHRAAALGRNHVYGPALPEFECNLAFRRGQAIDGLENCALLQGGSPRPPCDDENPRREAPKLEELASPQGEEIEDEGRGSGSIGPQHDGSQHEQIRPRTGARSGLDGVAQGPGITSNGGD